MSDAEKISYAGEDDASGAPFAPNFSINPDHLGLPDDALYGEERIVFEYPSPPPNAPNGV